MYLIERGQNQVTVICSEASVQRKAEALGVLSDTPVGHSVKDGPGEHSHMFSYLVLEKISLLCFP